MKKLFRYIESKYEDWFDYDPHKIPAFLHPRYEAYVRFLMVLPVLVLLFVLLTLLGIFVSSPSRFLNPLRAYFADESIRLQTEGTIAPDSVRVEWNMVFTTPITVFEHRTQQQVPFGKQGLNYFRVYYGPHSVACFEHFRGDEVSEFDYTLSLARYSDGHIFTRLFVNDGKKEIDPAPCL